MNNETLQTALEKIEDFMADGIAALPLYAIALILVTFGGLLSRFIYRVVYKNTQSVFPAQMVRRLVAQLAAVATFLVVFYLALEISQLTQLAVAVLGGTGVAGLIVGFAFRDIAENFLSSLILTIQRPFKPGDVIEIEGITGVVERLTARCTVLMNFDGDHIQIPNSRVFKANIRNLTANPRQRLRFTIGIGYDADIEVAQRLAMEVLREHSKVLSDPESSVLVEELGASTVNLAVYYWIDASQVSSLKVQSSVMRMTLDTFLEAEISMPDEAREIIVPDPIKVISHSISEDSASSQNGKGKEQMSTLTRSNESGVGEGSYTTSQKEISAQMQGARSPENGANLLEE